MGGAVRGGGKAEASIGGNEGVGDVHNIRAYIRHWAMFIKVNIHAHRPVPFELRDLQPFFSGV